MILFKYLWIVILVVYLVALSIYTYFAFQEAKENLRDRSKEYNSKYTTMDVIEEVFSYHENLMIVWSATLVILFLASIIMYGASTHKGGG